MELKGSRTEANLMSAFAGETQARAKYTYYAEIAEKEGYMQLGDIFRKTAENEQAHAKVWFGILGGLGNTLENLENGASGEHFEHSEMYPEFAKVAREEGFNHIADLFDKVAEIEVWHEKRYRELISQMKDSKIFSKDNEVMWICRNCGHIHTGKEAPQVCPTCAHPQSYFEVKSNNY